jgi:hypothetical protein
MGKAKTGGRGGSSGLPGLELCQLGALNQAAEGLEGKNLPSCGEKHLLHVFATNAKAAAGDASYDLVFLLPRRCTHEAELSQMLDARHFVAGGAVVFRELGFDSPRQKKLFVKTAGRALTTPHAGH